MLSMEPVNYRRSHVKLCMEDVAGTKESTKQQGFPIKSEIVHGAMDTITTISGHNVEKKEDVA